MSGWGTIKAIRALEERVDMLGFEIVDPNELMGNRYPTDHLNDRIALQPKGDCLPHYSRDAKVWMGSLEELIHWLNGVEWARDYDRMLKISDPKKRDKAESIERGRQLMQTIKKSKLVQGRVKGLARDYDIQIEKEYEQEDDLPF
jgi:hypothetical protein